MGELRPLRIPVRKITGGPTTIEEVEQARRELDYLSAKLDVAVLKAAQNLEATAKELRGIVERSVSRDNETGGAA